MRRLWWQYYSSMSFHGQLWSWTAGVSTTMALLGYRHLTVNHTINFVDPNTGACSNHINIYWTTNAKKRSKRDWGRASPMQSLLDEVWGISVSLEASPCLRGRVCVWWHLIDIVNQHMKISMSMYCSNSLKRDNLIVDTEMRVYVAG